MSRKEEGYVRRINCICYLEFGQSSRVKYFMAVHFFFDESGTENCTQMVWNSRLNWTEILSRRKSCQW